MKNKNIRKFVISLSFIGACVLTNIVWDKITKIVDDVNYAECVRKYAGANFIECSNKEIIYIEKVATSTPKETAEIKNLEIKKVEPVLKVSKEVKKQTSFTQNSSCSPSKNSEVNKLLVKYFKDCKTVKTVWSIAQGESGGRQIVHNRGLNSNGTVDFGYLSINSIHRNRGESVQQFEIRMYNLEENIKLASKIYKEAGNSFTPWVVYNKGLHLAYLK